MPDKTAAQQSDDFARIEQAIRFIEENFRSRPSLERIAESVHLSPFHFNRLFKRWAGVTPGQFLRYLTLEYTKSMLDHSLSLHEAALEAGLSGPGRLHDLFVNIEAMTPGEYKEKGSGTSIRYGFGPSPFGTCLAATTDRGLCHLAFVEEDRNEALTALRKSWSEADIVEDPQVVSPLLQQIFTPDQTGKRPFHLALKGTNFQLRVWQALLHIPEGRVVSYQELADFMGRPEAVRAVAGAVARNPVAYLIPCHRVIAKTGKTHNYRWGGVRKKAIIGWEAARPQRQVL